MASLTPFYPAARMPPTPADTDAAGTDATDTNAAGAHSAGTDAAGPTATGTNRATPPRTEAALQGTAPAEGGGDEPGAPFIKLAMRNMVRKGRQSLVHFGLTAVGLTGFLVLVAWLGRPNPTP